METPGTALTPLPPHAHRSGAAYTVTRQPETAPSGARESAPNSGDLHSGSLLEYWRIIQRRKGTVIVVTCLGMLGGLFYTLPQAPVYQARAVIEIQALNEDFLNMRNVNPTADQSGGVLDDEIQTQVRILQSRALIQRVVQKLEEEKKDIPMNRTRLDSWREALKIAPDRKPTRQEIIENAAGGLGVHAQAGTRLIEISCDSATPQMAADFANALTREYIQQNIESHWKTTQNTGDWLTNQMEDLKIRLEKSEERMQAYASQSGLLITGEKDNVAEERVKQLQEDLSKAQSDRFDRQSRFELTSSARPESLAEIMDDPAMKEIDTKLMDLRRQLADLSSTLTSEHPKVQKIQDQISFLIQALKDQRALVLDRIRNDYEAAEHREDLLKNENSDARKTVAEQADQVAHYNILKREVDTDRQMYDNMLQRVKEASIAAALRASNIYVVDPAESPGIPYKPSVRSNVMMGTIFGFLSAICFVVLLDRADRTIQEPGDLEGLLGIQELGLIPSAGPESTLAISLPFGSEPKGNADSMVLITAERRHSALAEAVHAALTSILYAGPSGTTPHVLIFTSPAPREGKTTIAANLAVAMAQIHKRVILIDGDLRRPRLHHLFQLSNDAGLVDLLRQNEPVRAPLDGYICKTAIPNLSVMAAGHASAGDPTLLHSQRLSEVIRICRDLYDIVMVDTPPMMTMTDARLIARHGDGVILVARANHTSRDSLRDAAHRFAEDGTRVLGAILNDWDPKMSGRYGYYRYYSKYKHYYKPSDERGETDTKSE